MAILYWRLMGAHGLSATFTVDASYKTFGNDVPDKPMCKVKMPQ
jgi:hypothetical protein